MKNEMKWMVERDDRRREEDRIRDEAMMKMVEAISRQQIETTQDMRTAEQIREEARREELRIARERQEREHDIWEERLRSEREDREMWRNSWKVSVYESLVHMLFMDQMMMAA